jgi:hypothetical protein
VKKASTYKEKKSKKKSEEDDEEKSSGDKLVNFIYHEGNYFTMEGRNKDANKFNIIDNHLWYITKFMPNKQVEVKEGDVIRFGRIPFKIAKMVLTEGDEDEVIDQGAVVS